MRASLLLLALASTVGGQTLFPANGLTGNTALYADALGKSLLFFEAQRSGKLPADNRVDWRGDSALKDGSDVGLDLTGGYYDAGDHVKFGLPMASTVTMLAWGALEFPRGYEAAGQTKFIKSAVKWGLDYFVKCHPEKLVFYGQVGNGDTDHAFWGRPEDMTMARPSYAITKDKPGSDLAAETASALAAGSLLFKNEDAAYSAKLLQHAKDLYEFADTYRGKYSDSITNAQNFYNSWSGFQDELCEGAMWLFKATGDQAYMTKAKAAAAQLGQPWGPSWDEKVLWCQMMLAEETGEASYKSTVENFFTAWLPGGSMQYTPIGLVYRDMWGTNRYAANGVLSGLIWANVIAGDNAARAQALRAWGKQQIEVMLGLDPKSPRSFVVGFGTNPPLRPHHRAASCPDRPAPCDWNALDNAGGNPQVLYGALVGGMDLQGVYSDNRRDYQRNEVTTDYNSCFTGALAALIELNRGSTPAVTSTTTKAAVVTSATTKATQPTTTKAATTKATTKGVTTKATTTKATTTKTTRKAPTTKATTTKATTTKATTSTKATTVKPVYKGWYFKQTEGTTMPDGVWRPYCQCEQVTWDAPFAAEGDCNTAFANSGSCVPKGTTYVYYDRDYSLPGGKNVGEVFYHNCGCRAVDYWTRFTTTASCVEDMKANVECVQNLPSGRRLGAPKEKKEDILA